MLHLPFFFFIQKKGIPLPVTPKKPWSMDANLMHIRLVNCKVQTNRNLGTILLLLCTEIMHKWWLIIILLCKCKLD